MKTRHWCLPLFFLLGSCGAAVSPVKTLNIGQTFAQADAAHLPLCAAYTCRLVQTLVTEDKFTGGDRKTGSLFDVLPPPGTVRHAQFSVVVDARRRVQRLRLELVMPASVPPNVYRSLVLGWGRSVGLTATNLSPCLAVSDWRTVSRTLPFADLGGSRDGACSALTTGTAQVDVTFDLTPPIEFPK